MYCTYNIHTRAENIASHRITLHFLISTRRVEFTADLPDLDLG